MSTQSLKRPGLSGGATLRKGVTTAIRDAVIEEISEDGVGRLSVDSVARRAGVGKAAIYRRWPTKEAMLEDVLLKSGLKVVRAPDLGSLHEEVAHYLREATALLADPMHASLLPHLYAEVATNSPLGDAIRKVLHRVKRESVGEIVDRAIERGELTDDFDVEIALDVLAGPIYWHRMIMHGEIDDAYVDNLVGITLAGLKAGVGQKAAQGTISKPGRSRRR